MTQAILYPLLAMVLLSFAVLLRLGYLRVSYLKAQRIHPQTVADRKGAADVFKPISHLADHFQNLFEVPVLFICWWSCCWCLRKSIWFTWCWREPLFPAGWHTQ